MASVLNISKGFAAAIVKMQSELEGASKDRENTFFKDARTQKASKYADLSACWDACDGALHSNGLAVLQFPSEAPPGMVGITTLLVYQETGEVLSGAYNVPLKDPNNPQAMGSAITYGRRYGLCSVLGICPEDDDGNAAAKAAPAPKAAQKPKPAPAIGASAYRAQFEAAADVDAKKDIYKTVKNSDLEEPAKTALLKEFGDKIKELVK